MSVRLSRRAERALALGDGAAPADGSAPERVVEAALAALARGETHYTDRPGIAPLRERVAAWLGREHGVASEAGGVVITCGATEARFVAVQRLVEPGGALLCLGDPDLLAGALIVRDGTLLDAASEPDSGALDAVDALYLDAERAEPDALERWLGEARTRGWWVVVELPSGATVRHPVADAALQARTVTIGDLGLDAGMAGWRVGYLSAPIDPAAGLRSFKQALTICTTNLSQWGALALFEEAS